MAKWTSDAKELTIVFTVEKTLWDSLNKTQQQHLVRDHTYAAAEPYGEVSRLKGYEVAPQGKVNGLRLFTEDEEGNPIPEQVLVRSVLWVIPNEEHRAALDGA